jgi:hypothetical protein
MGKVSKKNFKKILDDQHDWPTEYLFKFIAPVDKKNELAQLLPDSDFHLRPSSKGNYISLSAKVMMNSSEEVISIYEKAYEIEGIISL